MDGEGGKEFLREYSVDHNFKGKKGPFSSESRSPGKMRDTTTHYD